jgi:hypothetical protein
MMTNFLRKLDLWLTLKTIKDMKLRPDYPDFRRTHLSIKRFEKRCSEIVKALACLLLLCGSAFAGDIITATVTISSTSATNLNGTNAASITVSADTRIWTNSVTSASTQILATTNATTAAFRLLQHLRAYPFSGVATTATNSGVVMVGAEGASLTVTISNSWATVAYRTNTVGTGRVVRVPYGIESDETEDIVSDGVVDWANRAETNKINIAQLGSTFTNTTLAVSSAATNFIATFPTSGAVSYQTITATNDVFFISSTNRVSVRKTVIVIDPNGTNRNLGFNSGWNFFGTKPTTLVSTNVGQLTLWAMGTDEANVWAEYSSEFGGTLSSLNGLTGTSQTFATGTSGSDFAISSASTTHTFNLPTASGSNRGALSSADWTTFNGKVGTSRQLTIAGTANEITSSAGAQDLSADRTWTLSLPTDIDLGGKSSLEIPNAAAPTVNAFGEIAGDNDLWAAGRGAPVFYDGTAAVALVGALVSDAPSNGQVPKWNTGGTITWEDDAGAAGGDSVTVDGAATVDPNFDDGGDINFTYSAPTITATVKADSVALTTDTTGNYAAGDAEAGGATKITNGNADATLANAGEMHLNTTDEQLSFHSAADGEISGEASLSLIQHRAWVFDPDAVCDGAIDRLFLMTIGDQAPEGIIIDEWKLSFEADPTTEVDLDLKYADAFIGVAGATVIDALDTTNGVSSEDTDANINGGAAIANGKVIYLEFGTAYTETGHQIIFELWYHMPES